MNIHIQQIQHESALREWISSYTNPNWQEYLLRFRTSSYLDEIIANPEILLALLPMQKGKLKDILPETTRDRWMKHTLQQPIVGRPMTFSFSQETMQIQTEGFVKTISYQQLRHCDLSLNTLGFGLKRYQAFVIEYSTFKSCMDKIRVVSRLALHFDSITRSGTLSGEDTRKWLLDILGETSNFLSQADNFRWRGIPAPNVRRELDTAVDQLNSKQPIDRHRLTWLFEVNSFVEAHAAAHHWHDEFEALQHLFNGWIRNVLPQK